MAHTKVSSAAQGLLDRLTEEQQEVLIGCSQFGQFCDGLDTLLGPDPTANCPFCHIDHSKNLVRYDQHGWVAWEVPARFTTRQLTLAHQIVFFPHRHLRDLADGLTPEEEHGYFETLRWARQEFKYLGGAVVNRFGDMRFNVGTIMHVHATIMVPNRRGKVWVPFQKSRKMWLDHRRRMLSFLERYAAGERA